MFCLRCNMKFVNPPGYSIDNEGPIADCPKCKQPIWDTHQNQWAEKMADKTFAVDAASDIYCVETGVPLIVKRPVKLFTAENKTVEDWEAKNLEEEKKQDAKIDAYLSQFNNTEI